MTTNLDALDKLIAELPDEGPPKKGEFTIYQFIEKYQNQKKTDLSQSGAYKMLQKMEKSGSLKSRTGRVNGKQGKIYAPTK